MAPTDFKGGIRWFFVLLQIICASGVYDLQNNLELLYLCYNVFIHLKLCQKSVLNAFNFYCNIADHKSFSVLTLGLFKTNKPTNRQTNKYPYLQSAKPELLGLILLCPSCILEWSGQFRRTFVKYFVQQYVIKISLLYSYYTIKFQYWLCHTLGKVWSTYGYSQNNDKRNFCAPKNHDNLLRCLHATLYHNLSIKKAINWTVATIPGYLERWKLIPSEWSLLAFWGE